MQEKTASYGIRALSRLTGLPAHTLRLWEERYGAIKVARSPGGHRVYSGADLERITQLKRLVDQGHRISELAHLTDAALADRLAADTTQPAESFSPGRAAVFGESLPAATRAAGLGAHVQVTDNDWNRFEQACVAAQPDAVILEFPDLTPTVVEQVRRLVERCPDAHFAASFYFARGAHVAALHDAGVATLQAPVGAADLWWLVSQPPRAAAAATPPARPVSRPADEPSPRLFSAGQLTRLAKHASAVACECPAHLAQLVQSLNAFERYSADCENTSPDDAALHAFLHHETGRARAIMEAALAWLAEAEAIEY